MNTMSEDEAIQTLKDQDFAHVYAHEDGARVKYEPHSHDTKTSHIVVRGDMTLVVEGRTVELQPGDRFDIPAHAVHSAVMGNEGCRYIIGE